MNHLNIDIETYSSIDIFASGAYKYAQSPDFEILLFAYSLNNSPVKIVDLAQGEKIPNEIIKLLNDPDCVKHAYNAAFEWWCLNQAGYETNIKQWQCTMVQSLYCSYPGSLEKSGEALKLPPDQSKSTSGKNLIKYFSIPCKATKKNGGRLRNLPHHAPEKWQIFKDYCVQDVVTEMEVLRRFEMFPVPEKEWELWQFDVLMNSEGVKIDTQMVESALYIDEKVSNDLQKEAKKITGLSNPNSTAQLKPWLIENGLEIDNLQKGTVSELVGNTEGEVKRILEIRQELSKTSTKKYVAMRECAGSDDRARGLLQFYGANRTGRYSGRLIQIQNLPRNYLDTLDIARELVKSGDLDTLELFYGNIPDTLSQLIRTAFIPESGKKFIVADFSAIEARVIAWLAGEEWRQNVFRTHGKIYEASASQMFGVPLEKIVKGNKEYELRQKGKVAELACIAEGSLVLTDSGLVPIEEVKLYHKVWDGENFVKHKGVIYKGIKEVITYGGLEATEDHLIWVDGTDKPIRFGDAAASSAHLLQSGAGREAVRIYKNNKCGKKIPKKLACAKNFGKVCKLWKNSMVLFIQFNRWQNKWVSKMFTASKNSKMVRSKIYSGKTKVHKSKRWKLSQLWWQRDRIQIQKYSRCGFMDDGKLWASGKRDGTGSNRRGWSLRTGKFKMGNTSRKLSKSKKVYDILECGPNNRFTVSDVLVHNCGYGGGVGALKAMGADKMGLSDEELQQIIHRWRASNKRIYDLWQQLGNAAAYVIENKEAINIKGLILAYEYDFISGLDFMTIQLPNKRKLYYASPGTTLSKWNTTAITYKGVNQTTRKWETQESYGGKLVENVTQAIARDCLAESLLRVKNAGFKTVMHIHDEIVVEAEESSTVEEICDIMGEPIEWADGLLLKADGFESYYYKKD